MWRPFGENAGLSLLPIPLVNWIVVPVCETVDAMSYPPPDREAYAISLNGAGDHVGRSHQDSLLISRTPVPSAFMM